MLYNHQKKGFSVLLIIFIFSLLIINLSYVNLSDAASDNIQSSYTWIKQEVSNPTQLTTWQLSFSLMALSKESISNMLVNTLYSRSYQRQCFGSNPSTPSDCNIEYTAVASLALKASGKSITDSLNWLKQHKKPVEVDSWYIQALYSEAMTCVLRYYDNTNNLHEVSVSFDDDGVDTTGDTCIRKNDNFPFWLQVQKGCFNYSFVMQCDKSFSLMPAYQVDGKLFVPSVSYGSGLSVSFEQNIYCLADTQSNCDYLASLIYFYLTNDEDVLPYLMIYSEQNTNYFPEAWLYLTTKQDQYLDSINNYKTVLPRGQAYYTAQDSKFGVYFDSALASFALMSNSQDTTDVKDYIKSRITQNGLQSQDAITDTAFNLYVFWQDYTTAKDCSQVGSCKSSCSSGEVRVNYHCSSGICCKPVVCEDVGACKSSCSPNEKKVDYSCAEGVCCKPVEADLSECDSVDGACASSCLSSEIQIDKNCTSGLVCCKKKSKATCSELSGNVCNNDQKCVKDGNMISFTQTKDSNFCCQGECKSKYGKCTDLGGIICSSGFCLNNKWLNAGDTDKCCKQNFCSTQQSCSSLGGQVCDNDETCVQGLSIEASDGQCCVQGGKCVPRTCSSQGGEVCSSDESCSGSTVETAEGLCCLESCVKDCTDMGGQICDTGYKCSTGFVDSADSSFCCQGECKKTNFALIIVPLVIIILGFLIFMFMKKGKFKGGPKKKVSPPTLSGPQYPKYPQPYRQMPMQRMPIQRMPTKQVLRPQPLQQIQPMQPQPTRRVQPMPRPIPVSRKLPVQRLAPKTLKQDGKLKKIKKKKTDKIDASMEKLKKYLSSK